MMWKDEYALGVPAIDAQHQRLVEMVTSAKDLIHDAEDGVDCFDEISGVLNELQSYTAEHFHDEENFMADYGFGGLDAHKEKHDIFIDKVDDFLAMDIDADQLGVIDEVVEFLMDWVINHIISEDRQYLVVL